MPSISELKAAREGARKKGPSLAQLRAEVEATKKRGQRDRAFRRDYFSAGPQPPVSDVTAAPPRGPVTAATAQGQPEPQPFDRVKQLILNQGEAAPSIGEPSRYGKVPPPDVQHPIVASLREAAGAGAAFTGKVFEAVTPEVSPDLPLKVLEFFDPTQRGRTYRPGQSLLKFVDEDVEKTFEEHPVAAGAGAFVGEGVKGAALFGAGMAIPGFAGLSPLVQGILTDLAYGQIEEPGAEGLKLSAEVAPYGIAALGAFKALPTIGKAAEVFAGPRIGEPFPDAVKAGRENAVTFAGRKKGTPSQGGNAAQPGAYIFHDPLIGKMVVVDDLAQLPEAIAAKRALLERGKMGDKGVRPDIEPGRELGKSEEAAFPEQRTPKVAPPKGTAKPVPEEAIAPPDKKLSDTEGQEIADALGVHYGGKEDFYDQFAAIGRTPPKIARNMYTFRDETTGGNFSASTLDEAKIKLEKSREEFASAARERAPITERPLTPEERLTAQEAAESTRKFEEELNVPGPEPGVPTPPPGKGPIEEAIDADIAKTHGKQPPPPGQGAIVTLSGRTLTPPVQKSKRVNLNISTVDKWLVDEAIAEAKARGDEFNLDGFGRLDAKKLTRADRDGLNLYLFGVEEIPLSGFRPEGAKPPLVETPKQAVEEIVEGKAESKIGMADFKTQMTARLDEAIAAAPKAKGASKVNYDEPFGKKTQDTVLEVTGDFGIGRIKKSGKGYSVTFGKPTYVNADLEGIRLTDPTLEGLKAQIEDLASKVSRDPGSTKKITISIPGDGEFTIENNAANLHKIRQKVSRIEKAPDFPEPTGPARDIGPRKPTLSELRGSLADQKRKALEEEAKKKRKKGGPKGGAKGLQEPEGEPLAAAEPTAPTRPVPGGHSATFTSLTEKPPGPIPPGVSKGVAKILRRPVVTAPDIVKYVGQALNQPAIRIGKQFRGRPRTLGLFFPGPQSIWQKAIDDFPTLSHEFAHNIDNQVLGTSRSISSGKLVAGAPKGKQTARRFGPGDAKIRKELMDLDYDPKARRVEEGFAEYMRYRFTSDLEGPRRAPLFHEWFNTEFLPKNPELAQVVLDTRELIRRFQDQGAAKRMNSWVDRTKGPFENMRDLDVRDWVTGKVTKMRVLWEDDIFSLEKVERAMLGGKLAAPEASPSMIARALKSSDQATATYFVEDGAINFLGTKVGPGLTEILAPFSREEIVAPGGLIDAMISWVVVQRAKRGQSFTGYRVEDAQWVVDNVLNGREDYQVALQQITDWGEHLMRYLQDAGGLSEEAITRIKTNNEFWLPLMRVFSEAETRGLVGGGGRGFSGIGSPIKGAKGGEGRQIVDPLESLVDYARQIISVSNKVRVGRALVGIANKNEGLGRYIQEVQPPKTPVQFQAEQIKNDILAIAERHGIEIELPEGGLRDDTWDDVLTVYVNAPRYSGKDNVISIMQDGAQKFYEVDKDVYRAFEGLDNFTMPPSLDWLLGKPARSVRLGATGLNLGFQGTNVIRDAQTFAIQSQYFNTGKSLIPFGGLDPIRRAFMEELRGSASFERFKAAGLEMSGQVGSDRQGFKRTVDALLADTRARKAWNIARHPIDITREMLSIFENAPRFAEFKLAEAAHGAGTPRARIEGALAAREVTTNFQRAGYYGRWANQMIPFFNPAIQGISKWGRQLIQNPRMTMLKAGTNITIPSVGIWMWNKDEDWYRRLEPWDKWGFFHFPVGTEEDGSPRIMRLPRPFEWGYVFGADVVATLDQMYGEDPGALMEAMGETAKQFVPPVIPTLGQVPVEVATNFDLWKFKPIVPYFLQKYNYPADQYYGSETEFALELGKLLEVSPRMIDHVIRGYTGGLGIDALRVAENSADFMGILPDDPTDSAADWPIIGRFFSRIEDEVSTLRSRRLQEILKRSRDRNRIRKENELNREFSPNAPGPVRPPKVTSPPKPVAPRR